jgi:hypothetical protein
MAGVLRNASRFYASLNSQQMQQNPLGIHIEGFNTKTD